MNKREQFSCVHALNKKISELRMRVLPVYVSQMWSTLLCLIVRGGQIAFFQIFHPQNHFIMTPLFYQSLTLEPTNLFIKNTTF